MIFAMELILFSVNFLNRSGFSGRCMQPAANLRHTIHQPLRELLDVRLLAKGLVNLEIPQQHDPLVPVKS